MTAAAACFVMGLCIYGLPAEVPARAVRTVVVPAPCADPPIPLTPCEPREESIE
jgi:hypothetical protein